MDIGERVKAFREASCGGSNTVFADMVGESTKTTSNWCAASSLSQGVILKIKKAFPQINLDWLITGEGNMTLSESACNEQTRPRIPMTVAAGTLNGFGDAVLSHQCEQVPVVKMLPDYDYTMIVKGDSMEPKFEGGDEIAIKRVSSIIEWGKPYVLDTRDGAILKRLYDAGDKYRCVSYNSEYSDIEVPKDDVFGVYRVVGLIRI